MPSRRTESPTSTCRSPPTRCGRLYDQRESPSKESAIADDVLELLREYAANGTPCVLATVVRCEPPTSARPGDKAVVTADGRLRGWIGGSCSEPGVRRQALRALAGGMPHPVKRAAADDVEQTTK